MQVARMESDSDMVVKRLSVPMGLEELMESLTKEVLRRKPSDIYAFASEHFSQLLEIRDQGNGKGSLKRISKPHAQLSEDTTESTISKTNPVKVRTAVFATTSKVPRAMVRNKSPAPKSFLIRKNVPAKVDTNIPRRVAVNTNTSSNRQDRMKAIMEKRKANKKNSQDSKSQPMPEGQPSELESRKIVEFPRKTDGNKRRAEQRRQSLFQRKNEEGDNAERTRSRSSSKSKQDDTFRTSTERTRRKSEVLRDSKKEGAKSNLKQTGQLKPPRVPAASEKTSPRNKNVNKLKKLPSNIETLDAKDSGLVTADSKTKGSNASSKIETSLSQSNVDEMSRNVEELETTMTSSVDSKQELMPKMELHDEKIGVSLDDAIVTQMEQQELESSSIIESSKASGSGNEDSEVFGTSKIHEPCFKDETLESTVIDVDGKEIRKDSKSDAVDFDGNKYKNSIDKSFSSIDNKVIDDKADKKNIELKDFLDTTNAAVKIQSLMRGYLARKAIQKIMFNSEGKEEVVQDINHLMTHIEEHDKSFEHRDNKTTKEDINMLETGASNKSDIVNNHQIPEQSSALKDDIVDEIQSIVKIQALTRGYLTRKLIRKNKTADSKSEANFQDIEEHIPKSKLSDEVKSSAEKTIDLQKDGGISETVSSVEEVKVKCIVVENENQASAIPSEVPDKLELESDNKELKEVSENVDVNKAATLIQALYRGHLGRKAMKVLEQRELDVKDAEVEDFNNTVASQQVARADIENKTDSNDGLRKGESVEDELKVIDQFGEVFRKETANFLEQEHVNYDSNRYDSQEKFDGNKPFGDNVKNRANSIEKLADVPNYLRNKVAEMRVEDLQKPPECDELPYQKGGPDDVMRAAIVIQAIFRGYIARKRCESNDQHSSKKRGFEGTLPPLFEVEVEDNKYAASSSDHDQSKESLSILPNVENEPTETESSVFTDNALSRCETVSDEEVFDILKKLDDVRIPEEEPRRKSKTYSRSLTFDDPSIQQTSINQLTKSMTFVVGDEFQRFNGSDSGDRSLESIGTDTGSVSMKSTDSNKQSEEDNYITEIATAIKEDVQKLKETLESGIATSVVTGQEENDGNIAEITKGITEDIKQLEKTLKQDSGDFKNSLRETDSTETKEASTRPVSKDSITSTDSVDTVIFNDNYKKERRVQIQLQQSTTTEASSEDKTDKEANDRQRINAIKAQGDILVSDILDTARNKLERENPDAEYFEEDAVMNQFTFDKRQSTTSDELRQLWQDEAATTIQKNFRGYRVRRDLGNHKEEAVDVIKAKEERADKEITRYLQQITEPIRRAFSAEKSVVNVDEGARAFKKRAYSADVEGPKSIYIPLRDYSDEEKEVLKEIPVIKSTSLEDVENIHVAEANNNDLALRTEEMKRDARISKSTAETASASDIQGIEDGKDKTEDADEKISSCISALIEPITKTFQSDVDLVNTEKPDVISEELGPVYEYIPLRNYSEDKENENNSTPHLDNNIITSISILKEEKEESKDTYGDVGVDNEDQETDKKFQYIYDQIVSNSSQYQSTDQSFDKISNEIMEEGVESMLGDKPDKEPAKQTVRESVPQSTLKQDKSMSLGNYSLDKSTVRKQDEQDLEAIESKIYDSRNIMVGTQTRTAEAKGIDTGDKALEESEVGGNEVNKINIEIKTDNFGSLGEKEIDYLESSTQKQLNSHVRENTENLLVSVDKKDDILNSNGNVKAVKGSATGEYFEDAALEALAFSGMQPSDVEQHEQDSSKLQESVIAIMEDEHPYTQQVIQIVGDIKHLESNIGDVFPIATDKLSQDQNLEPSGNSNPADYESKRNDDVKEIEEQKLTIEQEMKLNTDKDDVSLTDDIKISESHAEVDSQILNTPLENKTETVFIHEESTSDGKIIVEDNLSNEINELSDCTKAMLAEPDKLETCVKKVELIDEDLDAKANLETLIVDSSKPIIDVAYINEEDMKNEVSQSITESGDVVENIDRKVIGENLQSPSKSSRIVSANDDDDKSDKIEDTIDTSEQISDLVTESELKKLDEKEHGIVIEESITDTEKNIETSTSELVAKFQDIEQEQLFSGFDGRDDMVIVESDTLQDEGGHPNGIHQESTTDEWVTDSDSISKMKNVIRVELKDKTEGENVTYIEENNNVLNKHITSTDQIGMTMSPAEGDVTLEEHTIDTGWNDNVNTNSHADKSIDAELKEQTHDPSQHGSSKLDKIPHDPASKEHIQNISPDETGIVECNKDKPDEKTDMVLVEERQEAGTNKTIESDETSKDGNVDVTSKEQVQNMNADETPTIELKKDVTRDVTLEEQKQEASEDKTLESADVAAPAGQIQNINVDEMPSVGFNKDGKDITRDMILSEQIQEATKSKSIELNETTEGKNIDVAPDKHIIVNKTTMDICNKDGTDTETTHDMTLEQRLQEGIKDNIIELDKLAGDEMPKKHLQSISEDESTTDEFNKDKVKEKTATIHVITPAGKSKTIEVEQAVVDGNVDITPKEYKEIVTTEGTTTTDFDKNNVYKKIDVSPAVGLKEQIQEVGKYEISVLGKVMDGGNDDVALEEHTPMDESISVGFHKGKVDEKTDITHDVTLEDQTQEGGEKKIIELNTVVDDGHVDVATAIINFDKGNAAEKTNTSQDVGLNEQPQDRKTTTVKDIATDGVVKDIVEANKNLIENVLSKEFRREDLLIDGSQVRDSNQTKDSQSATSESDGNHKMVEEIIVKDVRDDYVEEHNIKSDDTLDEKTGTKLKSDQKEVTTPKITVDGSQAHDKVFKDIITDNKLDEKSEILENDRVGDTTLESTVDGARKLNDKTSDNKLNEKYETGLENRQQEITTPKVTVDGLQAHDRVLKDIITENKLDEKAEIKLKNGQEENTTLESTVDGARTLNDKTSDNKLNEKYETGLENRQQEITTPKVTVDGSQAHDRVLKDIITDNKLDEKSEIKLKNDQEENTTLESTVDGARTLNDKTSDNKLNEKYETGLKNGQQEITTPKITVDGSQAHDRVLKDIITDNKLDEKSEIKLENDQEEDTTLKGTVDGARILNDITSDNKLNEKYETRLEDGPGEVTTPKSTVDGLQAHDRIFNDIISDNKLHEIPETKLEGEQKEVMTPKSTIDDSPGHARIFHDVSDKILEEKSTTKLEHDQEELTAHKSNVDGSQGHDGTLGNINSDNELDEKSKTKLEGEQGEVTTLKSTVDGSQAHDRILNDSISDYKLDGKFETKFESDQEEVATHKGTTVGEKTLVDIKPDKLTETKLASDQEEVVIPKIIVGGLQKSMTIDENEPNKYQSTKEIDNIEDEEFRARIQNIESEIENVLGKLSSVAASEIEGPSEDDKKECKNKKNEALNEATENLQSHTQLVGDNGDQLSKGASLIPISDGKEIASEHGGNVSESILKDGLTSHPKKDEKENNLVTQLGLSPDQNSYHELDNNVDGEGEDMMKQEMKTETDGNTIISDQDQLPANIVIQEQEPKHQFHTESKIEEEQNQNDVTTISLTDFYKDGEAVLKSNVVEIQKDSDHGETPEGSNKFNDISKEIIDTVSHGIQKDDQRYNENVGRIIPETLRTEDYESQLPTFDNDVKEEMDNCKRSTAINKEEVISKDIETPAFVKTLTEGSCSKVSTINNIEQEDINKHQLHISTLDENKDNIDNDLTSSEIKKTRDGDISSSETVKEGSQSDRNITLDDLPIEKHEPEATVADKDNVRLSTIEDMQKEDISALQARKLKEDGSDDSKYKNELKEKESVNDEFLQGSTEEPQLGHIVQSIKSNDVKSSESEVIKEDHRKSKTGKDGSAETSPANDSQFVGNLSEISQEISDVDQEKLTSVDPVKESSVTQKGIVNQDRGFLPDSITHQDLQEIASAKSELDESIFNKIQNAEIRSKDVIEAYEPNSTHKTDTVASSAETDVTNVSEQIVSEPSDITQSNLIVVSSLKEESTDMKKGDSKNVDTTITDQDRVQTSNDVAQEPITTITKMELKDETGNDRKASEQLQEKSLTDPIRDRIETSSRNRSLELKQLETGYMPEEKADLGKTKLSSNLQIEKNSVDAKGELAETKDTIVKGEDIPEQPKKEMALGSIDDQLNSQGGTNDMVTNKDESSELEQPQIDEKHGDAGDLEKIRDKIVEDIDLKNAEKLNGKPEEKMVLSGKEEQGHSINSLEDGEHNLETVPDIIQPISPFYLHQDTFFQNASTIEQEKKFAEALKLSVDSDKQRDDGEIKEKLLHSSEFHDSIPINVSAAMPEKHMTSQTNGTQCDISQERSTPASIVLVHSGELHDNILPLALQMNQDPAGIEIVTSSNTHQTSVGSILAAQASTKDVQAHFGMLATTRAQSKPDDMVRSMDTEKRNNSILVKKNMESEAATKIQASFRGYQVRKQLKNKLARDNITNIKRTTRRKSLGRISDKSSNKQVTDLEEQSATKIQAGIRGFLVRRRQKKTKPIRE